MSSVCSGRKIHFVAYFFTLEGFVNTHIIKRKLAMRKFGSQNAMLPGNWKHSFFIWPYSNWKVFLILRVTKE